MNLSKNAQRWNATWISAISSYRLLSLKYEITVLYTCTVHTYCGLADFVYLYDFLEMMSSNSGKTEVKEIKDSEKQSTIL